jgi:hypothetical protein
MFVVFGNSNGIYQQTIEAGQKSCVSLENEIAPFYCWAMKTYALIIMDGWMDVQ